MSAHDKVSEISDSIFKKNNENWHVWRITVKDFSTGGSNTPIDRWVSAKATKGDLIPQENF